VALEATVAEFNRYAPEGRDPLFGKGTKAYNRYQGDALNRPNPCVAPIETGPYYAIKVVVGDLGTYAGLITDRYSRVLDRNDNPLRVSMLSATTPRASWAATIPGQASRSVRR
jgi:hypothetical protein